MLVRFLSASTNDNPYIILNGWGKCSITDADKNVIYFNSPLSKNSQNICNELETN